MAPWHTLLLGCCISTLTCFQIGKVLGVAVNEDSGEMLLGTDDGLYAIALDGTATYANKLDTGEVPAVVIDPTSWYAYYGGRDQFETSFVKFLRSPFGSEQPRNLYNPYSYGHKDSPRGIAIDTSSGYMYVVDKSHVFRGLLDGTSPLLEVHYGEEFFEYDNVRTIDFYMDQLFIGVWGRYEDSTIWTANADGSGIPEILYNVTVPYYSKAGIKGLVVRDCGPPTPSPTPCDPNKSETTQVFPHSSTMQGVPSGLLTLPPFIFNVGWQREKMTAITINLERKGGTSDRPIWDPAAPGIEVDVDSWVDGAYVHLYDFSHVSYGTYRWSVSVSIVDDVCLEEDTTEWKEFDVTPPL